MSSSFFINSAETISRKSEITPGFVVTDEITVETSKIVQWMRTQPLLGNLSAFICSKYLNIGSITRTFISRIFITTPSIHFLVNGLTITQLA